MRRPRRFWTSFVIALATSFPVYAHADAPPKAVAASIDDDAADKEIERLFVEGKYDAALERAEKLVADREIRLGKEHPRTASAISDLGAMHLVKGNVATAEPLLERAVEMLEKAKDNEGTLATALSNLARVYSQKGDSKRAVATLERAIALEEKAGPARESELGSALANLGNVYMKGKPAQAEKLFLKAIAIHEKRNNERALFLDWSNLASVYRGLGRYDKAADAFNRAVPIAKRLYGEKHPDVGKLYHAIGVFLTGQLMAPAKPEKDIAAANRYFQQSSDILVEALGAQHPEVASVWSDWALMLTRTGSVEKALELRDKAQVIEENWLANALASGSEEDKLAYALRLERTIDRVVSFQMWSGPHRREITRFVLRTILRNKAQALEATAAAASALRERMTPENKKRYDDLVRVRGELASLYTRGPRGQTVTQFQAEIDALARQAEAIDAEISKESAAYRRSTEEVTLEAIAERIPQDAALVELVRYRHDSPNFYSAVSERLRAPMYMAYVLRHDGQVFQIQLPVETAIDEKVANIRKGLQNPDDKHVFRELSLLHDNIFIRLAPHLAGVKHLLISPDGDLSLVPFGALIDRDGHFLAEKYNITYLSSGRDLLRFGAHDRPSSTPMLVANPDYDAPGEAGQTTLPEAPKGGLPILARVKFSPLPGTAQEAEAIRHIVPEPVVKLQSIATETALKQVAGPKILHVATHGFFLDDAGKAAKGARGIELDVPEKALPKVKTGAEDDGPKVEIVNPMFLSGLALAGANVRKGQIDDGILTAYEASALNLSGTELVVLSACETGVGSRVAREGVRGLRRALVLAGAETQVMSLWQVDDEATRDLMTKFYQNMFIKGLGRGEGMRQAQMSLLAQPGRQHPFYWAGFIVSGNWAPISGVSTAAATNGTGVAVPPGGAKGCGCRIPGEENPHTGLAALVSAMGMLALRRRKRRD